MKRYISTIISSVLVLGILMSPAGYASGTVPVGATESRHATGATATQASQSTTSQYRHGTGATVSHSPESSTSGYGSATGATKPQTTQSSTSGSRHATGATKSQSATSAPRHATGATASSQPTRTPTRPVAPPINVSDYVALGDSVAAGAGLMPLANASAVDEACDRSAEAYPYIVAAALQTTVTQLACSGAKVDEGIYGSQSRAGQRIPAQLPIAFSAGTPSLITATIGANDVRWNQFIRQCYSVRCGLAVDDARMKLYRTDLRIELTRMLNEISTRSDGNPPQVLISGYYSPLASTECLATDRITADEVTWLTTQTANLNQAIQSVIPLFSFATYVPVDFTGHELCSADPWVQGIDAAAPVHPTAAGQNAIAQSFIQAHQAR